MKNIVAPESAPLAAALSATYAAIYRCCHPAYTVTLSHQAVRALQFASEPGTTIQSLCRQLGCATNTGSEIARRLAEKGLVRKTRRFDDERVVEVQTTPEGERILIEQTGLDTDRLAHALARLDPARRRAISDGLALLLDCVSEAP